MRVPTWHSGGVHHRGRVCWWQVARDRASLAVAAVVNAEPSVSAEHQDLTFVPPLPRWQVLWVQLREPKAGEILVLLVLKNS